VTIISISSKTALYLLSAGGKGGVSSSRGFRADSNHIACLKELIIDTNMVVPEHKSKDVCLELTCFVAVSSGDMFCRYERRTATRV